MKHNIDKFIELNYKKLFNIVKKKIAYFKRDVCPVELFSNAYIYVVENPPEKREDIPKYFVNYCNTELKYPKSKTNRKKLMQTKTELWDFRDLDLVSGIDIEAIDFKDCISSFVKTLDRVDQIIWEVMFVKGKSRVRELSEHFDIPESTINLYRVRVIDKFKQHYKEYYNED